MPKCVPAAPTNPRNSKCNNKSRLRLPTRAGIAPIRQPELVLLPIPQKGIGKRPVGLNSFPVGSCQLPVASGQPSRVIRHSSFVIRHSSFVIRHSPFAIRHSPPATRHAPRDPRPLHLVLPAAGQEWLQGVGGGLELDAGSVVNVSDDKESQFRGSCGKQLLLGGGDGEK